MERLTTKKQNMEIMNFSNHSILKQNLEYFVLLIRIAMADGAICAAESEMLYKIGRKLGFTDLDIGNLIATTEKAECIPPDEFSKRFEQVYDLVKIMLADSKVNRTEVHLANSFAAKIGFIESEIPKLLLLLINGIKQGKEVKELFDSYEREIKS
jgi:uncharacterized tellurite resistance protein B-like protein